jgi:hypothetical protein
MTNYLIEIKALKHQILKDYYNLFNCKKTKEELRELYETNDIKNKLYITLNELFYIVYCRFNQTDYNFIYRIYDSVKKTKQYLQTRQNSLKYAYSNVARIYYLPNFPIFQVINDLKKYIKNASNIEIVQCNHNKHASITFKTPEMAMAFVLNNTMFKYGKRFCIVAFGHPDKDMIDKEIEKGYNTAVSTYNFLDL